jgi:hypothetical protein
MKFPNFLMNRSFSARVLVLLAGLFLMSVAAQAQVAEASNNIDQCRNGASGSPQQCIGSNWQNGNAGSANSHYKETDFIPYRGAISGLTAGTTYTFTIGYDILKGTQHAIDYLGTYNATETTADPCNTGPGQLCTLSAFTAIPIPQDTVTVTTKTNPNTNSPIVQTPGVITMWNGTFSGAATYSAYDGSEHRQLNITFIANASTVVFAFGGHVAWAGDWGPGNSAGNVSGSPYHTNYDACGFSCNTHENSLSADAIAPTGALIVRVAVLTSNCLDFSSNNFHFASTADLPAAFDLIDNDQNTPSGPCNPSLDPDTWGTTAQATVTTFGSVNISELQGIGGLPGAPAGFTLLRAGCIESGIQDSTPPNAGNPTVTAVIQPFEVVTCGFVNSALGVTAAPASVTGRVVTPDGLGLSGVTVRLLDLKTGEIRSATSNTFGYYNFSGLATLDFYQMTTSSKRYRFQNPSRTFTVTEDLSGIDFISIAQ